MTSEEFGNKTIAEVMLANAVTGSMMSDEEWAKECKLLGDAFSEAVDRTRAEIRGKVMQTLLRTSEEE